MSLCLPHVSRSRANSGYQGSWPRGEEVPPAHRDRDGGWVSRWSWILSKSHPHVVAQQPGVFQAQRAWLLSFLAAPVQPEAPNAILWNV